MGRGGELSDDVTYRFIADEDKRRRLAAWLKEHTTTWEYVSHLHASTMASTLPTSVGSKQDDDLSTIEFTNV
jgi:hypothetical protein